MNTYYLAHSSAGQKLWLERVGLLLRVGAAWLQSPWVPIEGMPLS